MLEYYRIDISDGIETNNANASRECEFCHYWYFLDKNFKYEAYCCNDCHDRMKKTMNFNDVAIVSIKGNYYRIHFWYMGKDNATRIMSSSNIN